MANIVPIPLLAQGQAFDPVTDIGADNLFTLWKAGSPVDDTDENLENAQGVVNVGSDWRGCIPLERGKVLGTAAYTSNFATTADGFANLAGCNSVTGNNDSVGGENDCLALVTDATTGRHVARKTSIATADKAYRIAISYYIPSTNDTTTGIMVGLDEVYGYYKSNNLATNTWHTIYADVISNAAHLTIDTLASDGSYNYAGFEGDTVYVKTIIVSPITENITWIQDTSANRPQVNRSTNIYTTDGSNDFFRCADGSSYTSLSTGEFEIWWRCSDNEGAGNAMGLFFYYADAINYLQVAIDAANLFKVIENVAGTVTTYSVDITSSRSWTDKILRLTLVSGVYSFYLGGTLLGTSGSTANGFQSLGAANKANIRMFQDSSQYAGLRVWGFAMPLLALDAGQISGLTTWLEA